MVFNRFLFFFSMIFVFCASPVLAADEGEDEATMSVRERIEAFIVDLGDNEEAHFLALTGSHNLIEVVKIVRGDVENAVERCVENNPDIADALEERFEAWEEAIDPIVDEAEANVKNMMIAQEYAARRDIQKLLNFMDDKREDKNDEIKKIPVTTPEACEFLRNKMDETEDSLTELLRSTLVSLPQSLAADYQAEDEEPAAEEDAEEAE